MAQQQSTQLSRTSVKAAAGYFAEQVAKFINNMPGLMSDAEARRLTAVLCVKAQATMEESGIAWEQIDAAKFVMDAVKVVTLGLDASNNECYPIPYRNNKSGKFELQCSPSAKGMIKLIMQYSAGKKQIVDFRSYIIREGDNFTLKRTPGNDVWEFTQDIFGEGKVKAYITIVTYEDGTSFVMPHTKADIEKRRAASKAPNSPAWTKWYDEMALAKAARRHCTQIPMQMPKAVQDALDGLDDETPAKDITPPTILLDEPAQAPDPVPAANPALEPQPAAKAVEPAVEAVRTLDDMQQQPMDLSWLDSEVA